MASLFGAVRSMVRGKRIEDFLNTGDGRLIDWTDEEILKMKRYNLQVELAKRNLEVKGNKKTLRQRLMNAVREEKEQKLAYEAMIESKRKAEADLEASGSIYVVLHNIWISISSIRVFQSAIHIYCIRRLFSDVFPVSPSVKKSNLISPSMSPQNLKEN